MVITVLLVSMVLRVSVQSPKPHPTKEMNAHWVEKWELQKSRPLCLAKKTEPRVVSRQVLSLGWHCRLLKTEVGFSSLFKVPKNKT